MHSVSIVKEGFDENLEKIARTIDEFEGYANPHASRIAVLADAIAKVFNMASHDRHALKQAALIHDIGELVMNRDYINAGRVLTDAELADMQRHPVIGEQEAAKRGLSRAVQLLVRWHHEWWNGAGYPDALTRERIPLAARILRVADTYAALTDVRPYSAAISAKNARRYLTEWAAIEFDPAVVKTFLALENLPELKSYAEDEPDEAASDGHLPSERENSETAARENPVQDDFFASEAENRYDF